MRTPPGWLVLLAAGLACGSARAQTDAGWVVDFTWTYEARSSRKRAGGQTGPAGTDTLVGASADVRIDAEVRGTIEYTGRLQGAAATNMPDGRNAQRYDSWRSYAGRGDTKMSSAAVAVALRVDEASRIGRSETNDDINARRKGLIGRVRHARTHVDAKAAAPWDVSFDGGDLQIDRVTHTLMLVNGLPLAFDRDRVKPVRSHVERMDTPAAAGDWDRSGPDAGAWRVMPRLHVGKLVFSIPPGADTFTLSRTLDSNQLEDPLETQLGPDWRDEATVRDVRHRARETLTLVVRRREAPSAAAQGAAGARAAEPPPSAPDAGAPQAAAIQPAVAQPAVAQPAVAQPAVAQPPVPQPAAPSAQPPLPQVADTAIDAARRLRGLLGR